MRAQRAMEAETSLTAFDRVELICVHSCDMKLTRERKIYGAILAIAMTALGVDQMLGDGAGGPQSAEAGTTMPTVMVLPDAAEAAPPPQTEAKPGVNQWLAGRLDGAHAAGGDAFQTPVAWTRDAEAKQAVERSTAGPTYRLRAVMMSETGGLALINDRYVRLGQRIDGLTLIEVQPGAAVLANDHQRIELKLEHTGLPDAAR